MEKDMENETESVVIQGGETEAVKSMVSFWGTVP